MPATEQMWRDPNHLHQWFGWTGLVLLLTTIWMFSADHNREWKPYQASARDIELKLNLWRQLQSQVETNRDKHIELQKQVLSASAGALPEGALNDFREEIVQQAKANGVELNRETEFASLNAAETDLSRATKQVEEARAEPGKAPSEAAEEKVMAAEANAAQKKTYLIDKLNAYVKAARVRENRLLDEKKFKAAEFDAARANLGLLVRDGKSPEAQAAQQKEVDRKKAELDDRTLKNQAANDHRKKLQNIVRLVTDAEDKARKDLAALEDELKQMRIAYNEIKSTWLVSDFPYLGKKWLELPVLDAFNSPNKIDNLNYPKLTVDFNFKRVPRFDRCTTCHKLIDKAMAGAASEPAFGQAREIEFELPVPEKRPEAPKASVAGEPVSPLMATYGLSLADLGDGLVKPEDVTINYVASNSPAAKALQVQGPAEPTGGLIVGDVVVRVNKDTVATPGATEQLLLETVTFGKTKTIRLTVRRGVPNPFSSHPRLDLYVGPNSPHPMSTMGCTICHEGQGTATQFKFASHAPNNMLDEGRWKQEHGWYDNHHWIYPQYEKRFAEATCLKCHHQVTELEASPRFPEAPAPKVTEGFHLIRRFGCYGCHEVNGYDGPAKRIGPDLRLEPNFFATAQQMTFFLEGKRTALAAERKPQQEALAKVMAEALKVSVDLGQLISAKPKPPEGQPAPPASAEETALIERKTKLDADVAAARAALAPTDAKMTLYDEVGSLAQKLTQHPDDEATRARLRQLVEDDAPQGDSGGVLDANVRSLADQLRDLEVPGNLRKVGPSLRFVNSKLDDLFLTDWIRDPKNFRPSTYMPRFFGHWDHLKGKGLETAEQFEPIEILGMAAWLEKNSQPFEPETPPTGMKESTPAEKVARGKVAFETRGCVACHNHSDFPDAAKARGKDIPQGPDLTGLGTKFDAKRNPKGREWLYSWIKNPTKYHPRTRMPNLYLDPITHADGTKTDPVDDIREYLLSSVVKWEAPAKDNSQPNAAAVARKLDDKASVELNRLALEHLKGAYIERQARAILQSFDPADTSAKTYDTTGGKGGIPESSRALLKGAEVELIGDMSAEKKLLYVGRKAIAKYGCFGCHDIPGFEDAKPIGTGLADWGRKNPATLAFGHIAEYLHAGHGHAAHASPANKAEPETKAPTGEHVTHAPHEPATAHGHGAKEELGDFYEHKLMSGSRIGFIAQKILEPRSYDFEDVENKPYNDRLRMPQFPFDAAEREAVITFVLGLVAEPPVAEFVYNPNPRQKAILEGRQVLAKYNCGGCHMLEMDQWDLAYTPGQMEGTPAQSLFGFLTQGRPVPNPAMQANRQGKIRTTLHGLPALVKKVGIPKTADAEGTVVPLDDVHKVLAGDKAALEKYENAPLNLRYMINLWQPQWIYTPHGEAAPGAAPRLDPQLADVGNQEFGLPIGLVEKYRPANSGFLARYLPARIIEQEVKGIKLPGSDDKFIKPPTPGFDEGSEVWAYGPPPLVYEGKKVQAEWLHNFLLEPYAIRPAVVLRMPKFNMSRREATQLVNYFAAVDDAEYPYRTHPDSSGRLATTPISLPAIAPPAAPADGAPAPQPRRDDRRDQALKFVGKNCAGCHQVLDYVPAGSPFAKAPNLARVYERLRPEYLRPWIASPPRILTYTKMNINFAYKPEEPLLGALNPELLPGDSLQQLDAVVDLLMHFDEYSKDRSGASKIVDELQKSAPPPAKPEGS